MNRIMCELLRINKHNRKTDNTEYYSVTILIENKVSVIFFKDKKLFDDLTGLDRLSNICLLGEFRPKDDTSFIFIPQNFEL